MKKKSKKLRIRDKFVLGAFALYNKKKKITRWLEETSCISRVQI